MFRKAEKRSMMQRYYWYANKEGMLLRAQCKVPQMNRREEEKLTQQVSDWKKRGGGELDF